ncbi:hypothetical protein FA95DRAFT_1598152 [Auriscalpium vulgare]|uniref:Uncharacterized protein n=1 Tax=Auriscalpium vulgare TaxID=40419 RepID=A0ACB8RHD7_9AGAM|nr:hypothetical protein FA95DRAFT_1598152 [Auriscalpium vulgare]
MPRFYLGAFPPPVDRVQHEDTPNHSISDLEKDRIACEDTFIPKFDKYLRQPVPGESCPCVDNALTLRSTMKAWLAGRNSQRKPGKAWGLCREGAPREAEWRLRYQIEEFLAYTSGMADSDPTHLVRRPATDQQPAYSPRREQSFPGPLHIPGFARK